MIIRETTESYIMIKQHDHAHISGEIIKHFNTGLITSGESIEDVIYAAYQHDRSWIGLDDTPIWNDRSDIPFAFSDYPLLPKLAFYKIGLDEIEECNAYAALLCSMHFCSFFSQSTDKDCIQFLKEETKRQSKIRKQFPAIDVTLLQQHFRLLQYSDNLSLYLCLNEPGAKKDKEHPWFKNGFKNTEMFHGKGYQLNARWLSSDEVTVEPSPFTSPFHAGLLYKKVKKTDVDAMGIAEAYKHSEEREQIILIK
ncbi:DUF3891 family protein [Bacillus salacetis]|uniref:DUF3891 family protein n=1 Tax=Bacillus salacetis TaxID=2315464 RepID=A0A3A1QZL6_9BACI|nr:DUF3891 family protein [Bacillus salacetis]RIW34655.1 DUF3891 family protein [Bacillus salacetis]